MGLKTCGFLRLSFFLTSSVAILNAAPQLRLSTAAVGPLSIATGSNGPAQTVQAYNLGDGALSLGASSSAAWLVPSVGAQQACSQSGANGKCIPIQMALNTASLQAGTYTALVTVNDPKAVDAPQIVTVTVQMGGGVPGSVSFYLPPTSTANQDIRFTTNSQLNSQVTTQTGQNWLSLALDGTGSFSFDYTYRIRATAAGLQTGSYSGTIVTSGSTFAPDNKTVPVTLQVTSQPIANVSLIAPGSFISMAPNGHIQARLAQNAPKQMFFGAKDVTFYVTLSNTGLGTLALSSAAASGGSWLSLGTPAGLLLPVTLDTSTLAPGAYSGTITLTTNAANPPAPIPVDLQVVAASTPWVYFGGAVDNQGSTPVAPGDIASVYGEQFVSTAPESATSLPLSTTLGTLQVLVNGMPAPIYYGSYGQINFEIPIETSPGTAQVQVVANGKAGNTVSVPVAARAPRILQYGSYGIIVNNSDGTLAVPASLGIGGHPAHRGDVLIVYAIGLGATIPPVPDGTASPLSPLAIVPNVTASFGTAFFGLTSEPGFVGLTPGYVGLFQINVQVPPDAPVGDVNLSLTVNGTSSNTVTVAIQ